MLRLAILSTILLFGVHLHAQDEGPFDLSLSLNTQQVTTVDPKIFETLEQDLRLMLSSYDWTNDRFEQEERIRCNFVMTILEGDTPNNFTADLAVQATRPVYGTGEQTLVFNYLDKKFSFYYEQFQAVQLSENTFTGNLPAVFGFYAYLILGYDYDTFEMMGGQPYFEKAQEIINRLPTNLATDDPGWWTRQSRNRYWLLENILSPRSLPLRRAQYTYHREGLDLMHRNIPEGRANCLLAIEDVQQTNQAYPGTVYVQTFIDAKRDEIIEMFKGAPPAEQQNVIQTLTRVDPSNSGQYRSIRSRGSAGGNRGRTTSGRAPVSRGRG
ncbi:MAG: DUF4835 family protein [Bacteroidota bacterium]